MSDLVTLQEENQLLVDFLEEIRLQLLEYHKITYNYPYFKQGVSDGYKGRELVEKITKLIEDRLKKYE